MREPACFACGGRDVERFHEVRGVPVHDVLLMESRRAAVQCPRGDLALALCATCGFIQNQRFDPATQEYSSRYEETQGYSETFARFAAGLAHELVEHHGLRHRRIADVGCGKGGFLAELCRHGDNRGLAVDPACVVDRLPADVRDRITVVPEPFPGPDLRGIDCVCCRHTLEHVQPVRDWTAALVEATDEECLFFVEVPDVGPVLDAAGFWDVYYEHCSYFTMDSLCRLLRTCGLEIVRTRRGFDGQYLLVEARRRRGAASAAGVPPGEDLGRRAGDFAARARRAIDGWRQAFDTARREGRRVAVWGGGSKAVAFLTTLGITGDGVTVVDINPFKQGKYLPGSGHAVEDPASLTLVRPDWTIVMNPIYMAEIENHLRRLGVRSTLVPVTTGAPGGRSA